VHPDGIRDDDQIEAARTGILHSAARTGRVSKKLDLAGIVKKLAASRM
jgi:hypothetical protein